MPSIVGDQTQNLPIKLTAAYAEAIRLTVIWVRSFSFTDAVQSRYTSTWPVLRSDESLPACNKFSIKHSELRAYP